MDDRNDKQKTKHMSRREVLAGLGAIGLGTTLGTTLGAIPVFASAEANGEGIPQQLSELNAQMQNHEYFVSMSDFPRQSGETVDNPRIQRAIDSMTRGTLFFPNDTEYEINAPIIVNKEMALTAPYLTKIKPVVDTDVIKASERCLIENFWIDGSSLPPGQGSGSGIIVGYDGVRRKGGTSIKNVMIEYLKGHGVVWEQSPYLSTEKLLIRWCGGDGMHFTANYNDNNHGIIHAHVVACQGAGYRLKSTPTNQDRYLLESRHHLFVNAKAWGCSGGGAIIETRANAGKIFMENNQPFDLKLTDSSRGNHLELQGTLTAYKNHIDEGFANRIEGYDNFDQWSTRRHLSEKLSVRKPGRRGSINIEPVAHDTFELFPEYTLEDVTLNFSRRSARSLTVGIPQAKIGGGDTIKKHMNQLITQQIPAIPAQSTHDLIVTWNGVVPGDSIAATAKTVMPAGLMSNVYISASNTIILRIANISSQATSPYSTDFALDAWKH
ncbi:hypothetical protein M6D81_15980 [Paenibacillus sp. J5C_2022]|uniref:hypothetical protein n=1 Tax=Paenibacillus sp. J5C2022 TaxID=2977129 RepID=UPI0021D0362F|nr:hypothetical protein [Paenibacillus sp. J5C2022]MCU6710198.1 hypothetical protein [Paenibacillus sp. J5C2022]